MNCEEIAEALKALYGIQTDSALAELLGVERQNVLRYKNRKTTDLQSTIISLLLKKLKEKDDQTKAD